MSAPRRMVLAGGRGFLGQLLAAAFTKQGWELKVLTRTAPSSPSEIHWDARTRGPWERCLDGADVLVNLCGQTVNCRYHARNRRILMDSRIWPTRLLGEALRACTQPPPLWINASTATLYRHTFDGGWDERGEIGSHRDARDAFSIELAQAWEQSFREARLPGQRPILLRSAMVLGRSANANNVLTTLRRLTRCGLGGTMGHGRQFVSWIHEADFCRALDWVIQHPSLEGPVNFCAPEPLPNREMMKCLREQVGVPFGFPAPAALLELGAFFLRTETELILKSRRVLPGKLLQSGFTFSHPTFAAALADLLPTHQT